MGEAAALVASLQAQQAELVRQIAEAEQATGSGARMQERDQAQRAAERGADADIAAAEQALSSAQRDLEAATRERDSLFASSSQVCMLHPHLSRDILLSPKFCPISLAPLSCNQQVLDVRLMLTHVLQHPFAACCTKRRLAQHI